MVRGPVIIARAIPEGYGISRVSTEEGSEVAGYKIECSWNRWHEVSNILLAAGIVSVTTAIFVMLSVWAAWLIPCPMANNSASVVSQK